MLVVVSKVVVSKVSFLNSALKLKLAIHVSNFTDGGKQNTFAIKSNLPPENFRNYGNLPMEVLDLQVG